MIPAEIIKKVRLIEIKTRHIVNNLFGGEYHSVFKGMGMEFAEVREYSPGDDIRAIDWNVTARMGQPYVKTFIEERELTIFLVVDCSASTNFGSSEKQKKEIHDFCNKNNLNLISVGYLNKWIKKNYLDYYTISIGIRNINNINNALKEAYRVLKPGGRFLCLEFSKVENEILNKLYKTYSKSIPQLGKFIVGKSEPYEYLVNSIEEFDSQGEFFKKIKKQNFINVSYRNLSGGIVAIHSAWKV